MAKIRYERLVGEVQHWVWLIRAFMDQSSIENANYMLAYLVSHSFDDQTSTVGCELSCMKKCSPIMDLCLPLVLQLYCNILAPLLCKAVQSLKS